MTRRPGDRLQHEIEELFADLWQVPRFAGGRRAFRPNVDCFHTDDPHALTVVVELPGAEAHTVEVVVGERELTIAGVRERPRSTGAVYQQVEIEYGPFERRVRLAEEVDPAGAKAHFEHGILTITLPVAERPPPRGRVSIEVEPG